MNWTVRSPKKIKAQADEITILTRKLSDALRKLRIIEECDRMKYELIPLSTQCSFRHTISDETNRGFIEQLFQSPQ